MSENDNLREDVSEILLADSTIEYLWRTLRVFEYEVVHADEVCSICTDTRFEVQLRLGTRSEYGLILNQSFAEILHRSMYCWLCRFLCRIVARASPQKSFTRCVKENLPVHVSRSPGNWERKLLLSVDSSASAGSYGVVINTSGAWRGFEDLQYGSVMTCHNLVSPPSKRFRKLFSDSVTQQKELFGEICRWISICDSQHLTCRRRASLSSSHHDGFRVIDVNSRTLCEPAADCSYVALSYVWGEKPFSRSCTAGDAAPLLSDLIKQINVDLRLPQILPQTIEDAIIVTQNLGQRYLWADILCIDQFDEELKKKAITAMDQIYSSALVTICVIDSPSMFSGIPGVNDPLRLRYQVITDTETDRFMFSQFHLIDQVLSASEWAKRAWTFQEGELSMRRLCFSENGIFLLCKEEIFHDILELDESDDRRKGCFGTGEAHYLALGFDLDMHSWVFDNYARMAASYSYRSMTFSSDAYHAITGAIQRMAQNLSTSFVAALPVHDICNALLWFHHYNSYEPFSGHAEGCQRPGFPSWSWLGWEGPIEYWHWLQEPRCSIEKQECIFTLVDRKSHYQVVDRAVKVQSSALVTFELIAPDSGNAILGLTTAIARFRISKIMQPEGLGHRTDHRWLLLDKSGQKIPMETHFYDCIDFCSLHLHSASSLELVKMNVEELEFVLLQHWSSNPPESASGRIPRPIHGDEVPEHHGLLEDVVWTIAIKRRPDGVCERLNLVPIPAKAWFMAEPQSTVVRIA